MFTEVLEHIAITSPSLIFQEFRRVLKPQGILRFSTRNVCNISNIFALAMGLKVFWQPEIFYGSTDRHNREYTPRKSLDIITSNGFTPLDFYGINDHANWRFGTAEAIYRFLPTNVLRHSLLRNTIIGAFSRM